MKQNPSKQLLLLKLYYLFILILTIILILPTHVFPIPYFMPFRFPHYLEKMEPFLGISWPATFQIYHLTLLILAIIGSLNVLGIVFYPKWKSLAQISSFIGIFFFSLMSLFFFFLFINVNPLTSFIYGFYCIVLLIVDVLTFKALARR